MADALRKVKPGDPLVIPAETFNAFVETAQDLRSRQQNQMRDAQPLTRPSGIVRIRNDSGVDRNRFDVLGVDGVIFDPADDEDAFKNAPALVGVTPAAEHANRFVVLLEPLADGSIGPAMAQGICPVKLDVQDAGHSFAEAVAGQCGALISASGSGGAQILWKAAGTGQQWALVRVGQAGGGDGERKYARITQVEGSSPPYLYSGQQVIPAANGTWQDVARGDDLNSNLYNIGESIYPGAGKVPVGRVVVYWTGLGCFLFDTLWYRGTYG